MATHPQNTCSLPESIRCYLLRGNVMVPLIPADQLPFQLKGIPRQLSHRQMSDQGWKLFKETTEVSFVLPVQAPTTNDWPSHCSPGKPQYLAPDHQVRTESQTAPIALNHGGRPSLAAVETATESFSAPFTAAVERQSSLADAVASIYQDNAQRLGYTSNTGSNSPKKVYCTHWIATGECRWTHTGCKYKHEMPGTEKLRELGFTRGTPKWWKEKNAVSPPKPLTWMQRQMARIDDGEQQTGDMPAPRTFPDPSAFRARKLEERCNDLGNEMQKRNGGFREAQPTVSKSSLPGPLSIQTPPVRCSSQAPNLIDLDDIPIFPCSSPQSQTSSAELSETPVSSTPYPDSSHPFPPSSARHSFSRSSPNRKTKPEKQGRTRTYLPPPVSSSSSSSSSSLPSESSDTDAPCTSKTNRATLSTHQRHKTRTHRKTSSTTIATSTRPVKISQAAEPLQPGLADSKHAVQTPATSSFSKAAQDTRAEQSGRTAHRKERRAGMSA